MCNARHRDYRRCLILMAILVLTGSRGALAGLYTMEQTLADFTFDDASIVYRRGSHTPGAETDDGEGARVGASSSLGQKTQSYGKGDGLRGVMVLQTGQNIESDLVRGPFNVFGSFPSASSHSNVTRLTEALEKLGGTKKADGDLAFMNEKDRLSGALATKYRGYGVYFSVGGLDQLTWINEMKKAIGKGSNIIELSAESENAPLATSAHAIPAPGSLALVLIGCLSIAVFTIFRWFDRKKLPIITVVLFAFPICFTRRHGDTEGKCSKNRAFRSRRCWVSRGRSDAQRGAEHPSSTGEPSSDAI